MNMLDAIENVMREAGCPLAVEDITRLILKEGLWRTNGKTPVAMVGSRLYVDLKKGCSRFIKAGWGAFGLVDMKVGKLAAVQKKAQKAAKSEDVGYVYILTNPSFRRDWVKIGMTERPVNTRSKELDNTAVPLPFEIYATLHTKHRRRIEKLLHGMIDDFDCNARIRKSREFFNIQPKLALKLLTRVAEALDEDVNICEAFKKAVDVKRSPCKPIRVRVGSKKVAKSKIWNGKTQLAKQIARRDGNEGAFGGILHYFARRRASFRRASGVRCWTRLASSWTRSIS